MTAQATVNTESSHNAACTACAIGAVSHVPEGGQCPMSHRRLAGGSRLYLAGTPAVAVYYVKHGLVSLTRDLDDNAGEGMPYAVRRPGSFLGLEALLQPMYLDSARTVIDSCVCMTTRAQMYAWLDLMHTARVVLLSVLETMARDTTGRARTDGTASQRVARWLRDASGQNLQRSILAGVLGMKPETLSRALAALARAGAVTLTRTRIEVRDATLLAAIAEGSEHV